MSCNFTLKLNGNEYLFKSEQDLNKFLYDNREKLKLDIEDFIKLSLDFTSEYSPQSEALAKLAPNVIHQKREIYQANNKQSVISIGEKQEGGNLNTITGTNVYKQVNSYGKQLVASMSREDFKQYKIQEWLNDKVYKTRDEAQKAMNELMNEWDVLPELGNLIHSIPELVFNQEGEINTNDIITSLRALYPESKITDDVILKMIEDTKDLKNFILKEHPDSKIYTELAIEQKGPDGKIFKGVIDLLVIDKEGTPHIYDFKTSSKNITQFGSIKQLMYIYQLGFYRQLLGSLGLDINNTTLNIIPYQFNNVDYHNKTMESVERGPIDILSNNINLKLGTGKYFNELNNILPIKLPSFKIGSDFVGTSADSLLTALNYEPKLESNPKDVDYFMKNPYLYRTTRDGKRKYFYDKLKRKEIFVTEENAEEKIKEYLTTLDENHINAATLISSSLSSYISGEDSYFRESSKDKVGFDPNAFAEYVKTGWEINNDFEHMGILLLSNPTLKIVDVINITGHDLTANYKLPYGSTILGNFLSDSKANDGKLIKSNFGNIELLRSMLLINDLLNSGNSLNGYKIGTFKVMSHRGDRSFHQNDSLLNHSFHALLTEVNKVNKANGKEMIPNKLKDVERELPEDRIVRIFQSIIDKDPDVMIGAKKHLETFSSTKNKNIEQRLADLLEELRINKVRINVKTKDFKTPMEHLAMVIAEAHIHYSGIDYEYAPGDYKKYGLIGKGLYTSLVSNAYDPFTQAIQREVIVKRNQTVFNSLNSFAAKVRVATAPLTKQSMSLATEWNMFDNLIEKGQNGVKFDGEFRVRNPYDMTNSLNNEQREYLEFFLSEMHKLLDDGSNGDPNSEEGISMIAAGTWFDIPLIHGQIINKLTSGGNIINGIKEQFKQLQEEGLTNEENLTTQDLEDQSKKYEDFEMTVNSMKIDPADRRKILDKTGITPYSRDLSNILNILAYKTQMAQINNEIMPLMRSLMIFNNSFMSINQTDAKNFQAYIKDYLQTQIFGINHIHPDNKKLNACVRAGGSVLAQFALSGNFLSINREFAQGFYNNLLNIAATSYSLEPPTFKQLLQGYSHLSAQAMKDIGHIGKINGIMFMFGNLIGTSVRNHADEVSPIAKGGKLFKGQMAMKMNMIPDKFNRLAPLIAFMIKDGCWDALEFNKETSSLNYNWRKDKRFEIFIKYRNEPNTVPAELKTEFQKQRSIYEYKISEFNKEGYGNSDGTPLNYKSDLPAPYIAAEIATLKDIINSTHGHMSKDEKLAAEQTMWVSWVSMFRSWLKTKVNRYTMSGGHKNQGRIREDIRYNEFNEREYHHELRDENGEIINEWWDTNPQEGVVSYRFFTDFNQGIFDSLVQMNKYYKQYGLKGAYQQIQDDPQVKRNLKYLTSDLLAAMILAIIGKFILDFDEIRKEYGYTFGSMLEAPFIAPMDNNPLQLISIVLGSSEPPVISMAGKWYDTTLKVLSSPSPDTIHKFASNAAVYRVTSDMINSINNM